MTISMAFSAYAAVIVALAAISGGLGVWNRCLRRGLDARVRHYVARDPLTGLPSRVLLHDRLTQAIAAAERRQGGVSVIFVDIDRFKAVNNTLGHDAGDEVLKQIGKRLRDCVGPTDTVARLGGDEFVLVMSEIGKAHLAAIAARQVMEKFAAPFMVDGYPVYCTASGGIAMHPGDGT